MTFNNNKVVLITGASGGIGQAAAKKFADMGLAVALHYHKNQAGMADLEKALNASGARVMAFQADLTDSGAVSQMFDQIENGLGAVSILINAAGYSEQDLFQDISDESWRKTMAINLDASFYCARRAVPNMLTAQYGVILNLSSIWGMTGGAMEVHYSTAKAAVIGMTKALAKELGPSNIRVNCLAPGWIGTDMNAVHNDEVEQAFINETPLGRIGHVEEVAEWIWFLCSEHAAFMTGQVISPNGGVVI